MSEPYGASTRYVERLTSNHSTSPAHVRGFQDGWTAGYDEAVRDLTGVLPPRSEWPWESAVVRCERRGHYIVWEYDR